MVVVASVAAAVAVAVRTTIPAGAVAFVAEAAVVVRRKSQNHPAEPEAVEREEHLGNNCCIGPASGVADRTDWEEQERVPERQS